MYYHKICSSLFFSLWYYHIIKIVYCHIWDMPQIQIPSNKIMPVNWWLQITLWQHNKGKLDFIPDEGKPVGSSIRSEWSKKHLQDQSFSTSTLYFFLYHNQGLLILETVLLHSSLDNLLLVSTGPSALWMGHKGQIHRKFSGISTPISNMSFIKVIISFHLPVI